MKKIVKVENEIHIVRYDEEDVDYLNYVTRTSTKKQRRKFDIGDIFINAAVCKKCNSYIRSINRHDYKMCDCHAIGVDGGSWYAKRMGQEEDMINVIELFYDADKRHTRNKI
jgi:hypothetical protein